MEIIGGTVLGDEDGKNKGRGQDTIRLFDSYKYGDIMDCLKSF